MQIIEKQLLLTIKNIRDHGIDKYKLKLFIKIARLIKEIFSRMRPCTP